jgi:xanthine/uracil/vitamin C permease (AzgA family)
MYLPWMRPTDLRTETIAGVTTFLTMSYIIFVQPAVLSTDFTGKPTGLDFGAVLLATCLASGLATIAMGLWANYPIALAPGMGENFFTSIRRPRSVWIFEPPSAQGGCRLSPSFCS